VKDAWAKLETEIGNLYSKGTGVRMTRVETANGGDKKMTIDLLNRFLNSIIL